MGLTFLMIGQPINLGVEFVFVRERLLMTGEADISCNETRDDTEADNDDNDDDIR